MDVRHLRAAGRAGGAWQRHRGRRRHPPDAVGGLQQLRTPSGSSVWRWSSRSAGDPLTDAASCSRTRAATSPRAARQVQARFDEFRGEPAGVVRVAALPSAAAFLLPGVLAELERRASASSATTSTWPSTIRAAGSPTMTCIGHSSPRAAARRGRAGHRRAAREPLDIAMRAGHPLADRPRLTPGGPRRRRVDTASRSATRSTRYRLGGPSGGRPRWAWRSVRCCANTS